MKIIYAGEINQDGKLTIINTQAFKRELLTMANKKVDVSVQTRRKTRSVAQNSFYFGVVVQIVREGLIDIGYLVGLEETHELLKSKFAEKELINEKTGEILKTTTSTASMSTVDFMLFIQHIQQWSVEYLGVEIPDPNEQLGITFES